MQCVGLKCIHTYVLPLPMLLLSGNLKRQNKTIQSSLRHLSPTVQLPLVSELSDLCLSCTVDWIQFFPLVLVIFFLFLPIQKQGTLKENSQNSWEIYWILRNWKLKNFLSQFFFFDKLSLQSCIISNLRFTLLNCGYLSSAVFTVICARTGYFTAVKIINEGSSSEKFKLPENLNP